MVPASPHVDSMGIRELRIAGMIHEVLNAAIDRSGVMDRNAEVAILALHVQRIHSGWVRRLTTGVGVGLRLDVANALLNGLQEFPQLGPKVGRFLETEILDIVEIF